MRAVQLSGRAQMWTPEEVLIVELGKKPEKVLEQYQAFYSCKGNLFLAYPGFPEKLRSCNNSCTTHPTWFEFSSNHPL